MQSTSVTAALQDALEKGDIVELEQAITAAEDAIHVSAYARKTSCSPLGTLIARAKQMHHVHMKACKSYVEPLRKACRELSERGIFEALVKARGAPDEVQLCMYTDLCNAESLRREITEAQRLGVRLLDSTSAQEVDDFLTECSPFLEDRTILALVQKREDLLREERRRKIGGEPTTPLRAGATNCARNAAWRDHDPLESLSHFEREQEGGLPGAGRYKQLMYRSSSNGGRAGRKGVSEEVAGSSAGARGAYPALCDALEKAHDSDLERTIMEGSSPWMQTIRALLQQGCEKVMCQEHSTRRQLESAEEDGRAEVYRSEMLSRVQRWTTAAAVFSTFHGEKQVEPKSDRGNGVTPWRASSFHTRTSPTLSRAPMPSSPAHASQAATEAAHPANRPLPPVYAMHSPPAYTFRPGERQRTPTRSSCVDTEAAAEGPILGSAVHHRVVEELHTPHMFRDTPNISPIKEISTASGAASLPEQDQVDRHSSTKPGGGDRPERGTPRGGVSEDSASAAAATLVWSPRTAAVLPSLELRRIQARLRAVLQEEDIHRRDIEGTEDFDRSVFLFPVSARIALLQRTEAQRRRTF
ncbi:hypothetical protein Q4I30_004992 [Leishmania utingensis]|uniref:Uncharacterized protein n=1 Tax=Leishmania utingensis TaxID=653362 RepID=A0AAW3ABW4_9TRYP